MLTVIVDPSADPQARGDPFKTLFVSRLSYDVKDSDLEREFGRYGPIERVGLLVLNAACTRANLTDPYCQRYHRLEGLEETAQRICVYRL